MKKYDFWVKVSNYSITTCAIILIAKMFFRKYLEDIITPILYIGGVAVLVFAISEIMKFTSKKN
ncbi:hypothetical protein DJ568_09760 [Mucilaginibacter hurinus]|uniref:Uncharacterized protein n=1 Tax=Mucilaginibacter hurinus TaxID=2201324 RepID=A0A367GPY8_9SPHI|nr:hypothetical protein [Mucilaginibacter hurinus]RCH54763.1 hypothetical protein DJ568_09760 [Mucilaginibacter hurinus]